MKRVYPRARVRVRDKKRKENDKKAHPTTTNASVMCSSSS